MQPIIIKSNNFNWMYLGSRSSSNLYDIGASQLPFSSNRVRYPHKRLKTDISDRELELQKELWGLEKTGLVEELEQERKSHEKSMRMIQQLISDNQKYYQEKKRYHPDPSHRFPYSSSYLTNYRKAEKEFQKPHDLTKSFHDPIKVQYTHERMNRSHAGSGLQKSQGVKSEIFKKLYQDSKRDDSENKISLEEKKTFKFSPNRMKSPTHQEEQVAFLKQQLVEKNKTIIDLQCEIIKLKKKVGSPQKQTSLTNTPDETKRTRKTQCCLQSQCTALDIKPANSGQVKLSIQSTARVTIKSAKHKKQEVTQTPNRHLQVSKLTDVNCLPVQTNTNSTMTEQIAEEASIPTEKRRDVGTEQETQTSNNIYDYIEDTYLEWMFEKEFKELQERKASQSALQ